MRFKQVRKLRKKWRREQRKKQCLLQQQSEGAKKMYFSGAVRALGIGIVTCTTAIKNSEKSDTVPFIHSMICLTISNSARHYKFRTTLGPMRVSVPVDEDQLISEQLEILLKQAEKWLWRE